jgi:hypothetical protein
MSGQMDKGAYPFWTTEELAARRLQSRADFKKTWTPAAQQQAFDALQGECAKEARELLAKTNNLLDLKDDPKFFNKGPKKEMQKLVDPARFMTRPFLSADNLEVLGEDGNLAEVVISFINPIRFPWVATGGTPTQAEIDRAVEATAELMAIQRSSTAARILAAKRQEAAAKTTLTDPSVGLTFVPTIELQKRGKKAGFNAAQGIESHNLRDLLKPGELTAEFKVAGAKCDLPILLPGGLLITLECKVSGSEVNSIKRLIRETVGKRRAWSEEFGKGVMTGALIAGNFAMTTLEAAQDADMLLFFEHEIDALAEFVRQGGRPRPGP